MMFDIMDGQIHKSNFRDAEYNESDYRAKNKDNECGRV